MRGIKACVVVPKIAPKFKISAIESYGGQVVMCDQPTIECREHTCSELMTKTGAKLIPPYNYGPVISGQGTLALELLEQVPEGLDAVIVPISGGGLISGVAMALKSKDRKIKVLAAEPTGTNDAADAKHALEAGEIVSSQTPKTIADGLRAQLGDLTWPIVRDFVDGVITVREEEILEAMRLCFEHIKVVAEPSGAAGLAAVLSSQFQEDPSLQALKRVGVILTGGNVDLSTRGFWDMSNWIVG